MECLSGANKRSEGEVPVCFQLLGQCARCEGAKGAFIVEGTGKSEGRNLSVIGEEGSKTNTAPISGGENKGSGVRAAQIHAGTENSGKESIEELDVHL